ncbi:zinc metalloprotease [Hydrogenimonas sp.]|nr:zinc metalloprotease [Hydrogenimonas sp.]
MGDGTLRISAPWNFSREEAERLMREKEEWIVGRLAHGSTFRRVNPAEFTHGCTVWYLGERYPVKYEKRGMSRMDFDGESFIFSSSDTRRFQSALDRFYLRTAKVVLAERMEYWSEKMDLHPKELKFRRYKSRWGCCSARNVITLNTRLLLYDMRLIDYVIIHELAHIRHKHHKKPFWSLVERYEPRWRELRRELV